MLKDEIQFNWGLAFSLSSGLFWRWFLIGAMPGMYLADFFHSSWGGIVLQAGLSFVGLCVAVKWLIGSHRLGSLKLIFMEQAHYQQLTSNPSFKRDAYGAP